MKFYKKNKGITLIALVITIIILLILAGISIASLTGSGLFGRAKESKEKSEQAQIKEEIEMAIMDIQIEEISKGNNVTLESLAGEYGQLANKLEGITAILNDTEINGEYKGYEYTIDSNLKVTVGDPIKGISFYYTLTPKGYTNGNITLTINAKSTNGSITNIEVNGLTRNEDGTFTITENKEYQVTVTDSAGETKTKPLNIQKIDTVEPIKAEVTIENIKTKGFTIKVEAEDGEATTNSVKSGIGKYVYKINGKEDFETEDSTYTVTGLSEDTEYTVKVIVYDKAGNKKETIEVKQKTKNRVLDYPILTLKGMMNCIDDDGTYYYDSSVECRNESALKLSAYDRNPKTSATCGLGYHVFEIAPECYGKFMDVTLKGESCFPYMGYINDSGVFTDLTNGNGEWIPSSLDTIKTEKVQISNNYSAWGISSGVIGITIEIYEISMEKPEAPKIIMTVPNENIEKTPLEYPILKIDGMINCIGNCQVGDNVSIELRNDENIDNYYSIDGGNNWIRYTNRVEIKYPGKGLLKAKSENQFGTSSEIKDIVPYLYDSNIECNNEKALKLAAYDKNPSTSIRCDVDIENVFEIDPECYGKYISITLKGDRCFPYKGYINSSGGFTDSTNGRGDWIPVSTDIIKTEKVKITNEYSAWGMSSGASGSEVEIYEISISE